jgi:hypothetical protein
MMSLDEFWSRLTVIGNKAEIDSKEETLGVDDVGER